VGLKPILRTTTFLSALTLLVGSLDLQKTVPDMTYNVFNGMLNFTQSINQSISVFASVNLFLHHKVQKFSPGTGSPRWSRKKGHKTVVVVVWWLNGSFVILEKGNIE